MQSLSAVTQGARSGGTRDLGMNVHLARTDRTYVVDTAVDEEDEEIGEVDTEDELGVGANVAELVTDSGDEGGELVG